MPYSYEIVTERLNPEMPGGRKYAAKLMGMMKLRENSFPEQVDHGLGEVWGQTVDEAYQKMQDAAERWILQRLGHDEDCPGCDYRRRKLANSGVGIDMNPDSKATCSKCRAEVVGDLVHRVNRSDYCAMCAPDSVLPLTR